MTKQELENVIISIKVETLSCWDIYFQYKKIGDANTYLVLKEYVIALNMYIDVLDYIYNSWEYLDKLGILAADINDCIFAALDCIKTFNAKYYG